MNGTELSVLLWAFIAYALRWHCMNKYAVACQYRRWATEHARECCMLELTWFMFKDTSEAAARHEEVREI